MANTYAELLRSFFAQWLYSLIWTFACFAIFNAGALGIVYAHPFLWAILVTLLRQAISQDARASAVTMLYVWLLSAPFVYWSTYGWSGLAGVFMINFPLMLMFEELFVSGTPVQTSRAIPPIKTH